MHRPLLCDTREWLTLRNRHPYNGPLFSVRRCLSRQFRESAQWCRDRRAKADNVSRPAASLNHQQSIHKASGTPERTVLDWRSGRPMLPMKNTALSTQRKARHARTSRVHSSFPRVSCGYRPVKARAPASLCQRPTAARSQRLPRW